MSRKKKYIGIISFSIVAVFIFAYCIFSPNSAENSFGYTISKKDKNQAMNDISAYYTAINEHEVDEMVKYTHYVEPEGRIEFLKDFFKNEFELTLTNLEIIDDFPTIHFDDQQYVETYGVIKAMVMKSDISIESKDVIGVMGLELGDHTIYLYVAVTDESQHWQIIDMSTISNP